MASIERQVERILDHDQGEVRIGVGPIIEQVLLPDVLIQIKKVVLETDYVCGGPMEVFGAELEAGALRIIPNTPSVEWRSACLFRTEALETPLVKLFVEVLLECRDRYLRSREPR